MKTETENLIVWDEKYAIGIPVIDGEHKSLIELCNNLYKVIINGNSIPNEKRKEAVAAALHECVDYVNFHFKHEEELMEYCNFDPEKAMAHKMEHRKFTDKIAYELKNFSAENHVSSCQFVFFLYNWILSHTCYVDRLYVSDLKKYLSRQK